MKNFFDKIKNYVKNHKTVSVVALIVLLLIGYSIYKKATNPSEGTRYVTQKVEQGNIISTVTGSGQISAKNSINLSSKATGTITYVPVSAGDQVKRGQLLFLIDNTSATKAVRDAQVNLESAQLALKIAQAQNSNTDTNQQTEVANALNNLLNSTLEAIPASSVNIQTSTTFSPPTISGNYILAKEGTISLHFYQSGGGISFQATGLTTGSAIANPNFASPIGDSGLSLTLPSNSNLIIGTDWVINIPNKNASNYLSNYNAYQASLETEKQSSSSGTVSQLNLEADQLAATKAENALVDAKNALSDYYILAPFDGTIASVAVQAGDSATGTLGTLIAHTQVATISLNEVDVAKIQLGQKVTLVFSAIPNLAIAGKVAEIDSVGAVSQGVVTYNVKIALDTTDPGIKPGMSVDATIITNMKENVLSVPTSAVKTNPRGEKYVEVFSSALSTPTAGTQGSSSPIVPAKRIVTVGISDDTNTEIISGLEAGDIVVTRTVAGTNGTTSSAPSIFGAATGNRSGTGTGSNKVFRAN